MVYSKKIEDLCVENNVKCNVTRKLKTEDYNLLNSLKLDFIIVCGWRTLIEIPMLKSLKIGAIAAHDSLLPKYRGFSPINWGLINGEKEFGVTLFLITEGNVDSGPVFIQKKINASEDDYAIDIYEKIISLTVESYLMFFDQYLKNTLKTFQQDESKASYTCARHPEDGHLNFYKSSEEVYNKVRALADPYPGSFFYFNNNKIIVNKAELGKKNKFNFVGLVPGRIISIDHGGVEVLCNKGTLYITSISMGQNENINPNTLIKSIRSTLR
jgi:methionyl-tRNA formyltransferase